jgi:hypothetical protein
MDDEEGVLCRSLPELQVDDEEGGLSRGATLRF